MKVILMTLAALAPLVACYDAKYDSIDVDKILGDEELFNAYINCMLDKGPCDVEHSSDFKELMPEVISTACAKCSEIQKKNLRKSVKAITERKPEKFQEFIAKYDPNHTYEKAFLAFVLENE